MCRPFEEVLVEQCAPTLAGLKAANLFRYVPCGVENVSRSVNLWNKALFPRGIRVRLMKVCAKTGACLVYVYRQEWVERVLSRRENRLFLERYGYGLSDGFEELFRKLAGRLCSEDGFPHEIGVFLGYPLEDVVGFIEQRGQNYVCCGFWKCYGDPAGRKRLFEKYKRCTALFVERFARGDSVLQLTAAV